MTLVDTSVWIHHFRRGNDRLETLLEAQEVLVHPFVIGELACGNLKNRREILALLKALPCAEPVTFEEALAFLETRHLAGRALGWIDVHLLASATVSGAGLWTLDKRIGTGGARCGLN